GYALAHGPDLLTCVSVRHGNDGQMVRLSYLAALESLLLRSPVSDCDHLRALDHVVLGGPKSRYTPFPRASRVAPFFRSEKLEARMRFRVSIVALAALIAGAVGFTAWTVGAAAPQAGALYADTRPSAMPVDTELVLAVDVSYSMDPEEQQLQREGYMAAIT